MDIYCIMFIGSPELSLFIMIFPFCRQIRGSSLSVLQKFELWTPSRAKDLGPLAGFADAAFEGLFPTEADQNGHSLSRSGDSCGGETCQSWGNPKVTLDGLPDLVNVYIANWKITMLFMGKSTISVIFNSYVKLLEGIMENPNLKWMMTGGSPMT